MKYGQGDPYNIVLLKLLSTKVLRPNKVLFIWVATVTG